MYIYCAWIASGIGVLEVLEDKLCETEKVVYRAADCKGLGRVGEEDQVKRRRKFIVGLFFFFWEFH